MMSNLNVNFAIKLSVLVKLTATSILSEKPIYTLIMNLVVKLYTPVTLIILM